MCTTPDRQAQVCTIGAVFDCIRAHIDTAAAFAFTREIVQFHRIQASSGYREAAQFCLSQFAQAGLDVRLDTWSANTNQTCLTQRMFREWSCNFARLELVSPWKEQLADFNTQKMSLIQRSASWKGTEPLEIVLAEPTDDPMEWSQPLAGKLLFVENRFERWVELCMAHGAAGILTVSVPEIPVVRTEMNQDPQMRDCRGNLSFHLVQEEMENRLFGFALTPDQAARLSKALRGGERVCATAEVDAQLSDGQMENVVATIPGDSTEEILLVAHLCHPEPSANDNASGASAAMEAMIALSTLIAEGKLPRPHRTIRLIMIPEFTGTYAYLSMQENRLHEIRAGINLDMVAGRQDGSTGPFLVINTPDAAPSFLNDLASELLEDLQRECPLANGEFVPVFHAAQRAFMPGSDHAILSDPTVDIPALALTQWPDKTYHTSVDSISHIDPALLARVSVFAASCAYVLASLTPEQAITLLPRTRLRFLSRMSRAAEDNCDPAGALGYIRQCAFEALDSYLSFFPAKTPALPEAVYAEKERLRTCFAAYGCLEDTKMHSGAVPLRIFRGLPVMRCVEADLTEALRKEYHNLRRTWQGMEWLDSLLLYRMNGIDSLETIAQKVCFETGQSCGDYLVQFSDFLVQAGLVKYV